MYIQYLISFATKHNTARHVEAVFGLINSPSLTEAVPRPAAAHPLRVSFC